MFTVTVAVRLIAFSVLSDIADTHGVLGRYPIIGNDSGGYAAVARMLLEEGRFASPGLAEPQSYVVPGYPVFLAGVLAVAGDVRWAILLQAILAGFSTLLIWKIGSAVSHRVGVGAALLFAADPVGIFYSITILTETLFIFLLLICLSIFVRYFDGRIGWFFLSGLVLGIATLTRPTALVVLPVLAIVMWLYSSMSLRRIITCVLVMGFSFFMIVFPWMLRNKILFDSWSLTAVATTQWFQQSAPLYYAYKYNVSHAEAYEVFRARLMEINPHKSDDGTLRNTPYMGRVVREFLLEDPFGYMYFHAVKTLPFFFSDGLRDIARRMGFVEVNQPNIGNLLLARDVRGLWDALAHNSLSSVLLLVGASAWFLIIIGMTISIAGLRVSSQTGAHIIALCLLIILATALIAGGPNASARYRFSVSPFMFIAAVYGFEMFRAYLKNNEELSARGGSASG
ncbi:MAG: Uncharacterized protein G01um101429_477 [Parcubacteria group bacterium Gr01-1014_29]|nr:MAG: Uncharacterized protein G01um101429_477 [Parcubacteria group bacterium Gr01-1014_29]